MKTIKQIRIEKALLNLEKTKLEHELSKELTMIINTFLDKVQKEHDAGVKHIGVEFMNARTVGSTCDHYIMQQVLVTI